MRGLPAAIQRQQNAGTFENPTTRSARRTLLSSKSGLVFCSGLFAGVTITSVATIIWLGFRVGILSGPQATKLGYEQTRRVKHPAAVAITEHALLVFVC
jgi:hypothetical protein